MNLNCTPAANYDIFSLSDALNIASIISITSELSHHIETMKGKDLVLDLSAVSFIDSSGVRFLLNLKKKMEAKKKKLYLLQPSETVRNVLSHTNVDKVFSLLDSSETLEKRISANIYDQYLPYTNQDETGFNRLNCSCSVCGSKTIVAYLLDQNSFDWKWVEDDPFPAAFKKGENERFDFYGHLPIVCQDCYMVSIRMSDFNIIDNEGVVIKSTLPEEARHQLSKSIKKRKKMVDIPEDSEGKHFVFPRNTEAKYHSYVLAEFCSRSISLVKKATTPFMIGYLNYLAISYAETKQKDEYINNCRTWFTQAISESESLTAAEQVISYFVLMIADMNLNKRKEAAQAYNDLTALMQTLPSSLSADGITSPLFWYSQAKLIWEKEIKMKSQAFHL